MLNLNSFYIFCVNFVDVFIVLFLLNIEPKGWNKFPSLSLSLHFSFLFVSFGQSTTHSLLLKICSFYFRWIRNDLRWTVERTGEWMNGRKNKRTNERTNKRMKEAKDPQRINGTSAHCKWAPNIHVSLDDDPGYEGNSDWSIMYSGPSFWIDQFVLNCFSILSACRSSSKRNENCCCCNASYDLMNCIWQNTFFFQSEIGTIGIDGWSQINYRLISLFLLLPCSYILSCRVSIQLSKRFQQQINLFVVSTLPSFRFHLFFCFCFPIMSISCLQQLSNDYCRSQNQIRFNS